MSSMLSEGFWGEKLYVAMAAMRFAEISECRMNHINRLSTHPELAMSLTTLDFRRYSAFRCPWR